MNIKKAGKYLLVLLLLAIISARFVHLAADPPETLSQSAGEYGDPAGYASNARNKILFGQWELDRFNPMYHTIIPHYVTFLSFKLFGVGMAQMNLVPAFFASLILLLLYFLFRRIFNTSLGILAFAVLGVNYLFIMYSRVANRIMPMMFFLLLALFILLLGKQKAVWLFPAGIVTFLAFITKSVCLYILLAFALGFFLYLIFNFDWKEVFLKAGLYASGLLVCFAAWYFLIYIPYGYVLKGLSKINIPFLVPPKSISKMLVHFWTRPHILFDNMPIISLAAGVAFLWLVFIILNDPRRAKLEEWIIVFWFAGGFAYYSIIYQRVTRHFIPQIIPLVFLAVWLIGKLRSTSSIHVPKKTHWLFPPILFAWLCFPLSNLLKGVLRPPLSGVWPATALLCFSAAAVTFTITLGLKKIPSSRKMPLSKGIQTAMILLILVPAFTFQAYCYLNWVSHPEYKLKTISQDLGKALDKNAVLAGLWAPAVCMENTHKAFESYPGYINDEKDFLDKFRITHVFSTDFFGGLEDRYYQRHFRSQMEKSRLIARYPIWQGSAFLYQLKASSVSSPDGTFELEKFTRKPGMPRYDPQASGGFAVLAGRGKAGTIALLAPGAELEKGTYSILMRIKRTGLVPEKEGLFARIDVGVKSGKMLFKSKKISFSSLREDQSYHEMRISFYLRKPADIKIRIFSYGATDLWFDKIRIQPREKHASQSIQANH